MGHANEAGKPLTLIADDDPAVSVMLENFLSDDYEIRSAFNGRQALDMIAAEQPDLILMDVMMPVMDGVEACLFLKSRREYSCIPVIMLTAMDSHADMILGRESGANDYICKPFSLIELRERMKEQLERSRSIRADSRVRNWTEFTIRNQAVYLEELNDMVERLHLGSRLDEEAVIEINLALREVLANAYEHGNKGNPDKEIFLSYMLLPDRLMLKIEDLGAGFDPDLTPDPNAAENLFKPRGRGVFIIKELMDETIFSRERAAVDPEFAHIIPAEERDRRGQIVLLVKHLRESGSAGG